jgi:hypothetical protein
VLFFLFLFVQKKRIQFAVSYIGDKASFTLTCKIDDRFNLTTVGVGQIVHLFQKNCQEKKRRKKRSMARRQRKSFQTEKGPASLTWKRFYSLISTKISG